MTTDPSPGPADHLRAMLADRDIDAVHELFASFASSVDGAYMAAAGRATFEAERQWWIERGIALRHLRAAVSDNDRDTVIDAIALLREELAFLRDRAEGRDL